MVWNEKIKREIPVKWEVKSLSSVAIVNQKSLSKEDILTEIEYLDTSSLTENNITETQQIFKEEAPSRAQRKVKQRTILYSTVRPRLKHYGILCNPASNLIVSTGFATIDALDIRLAYYIYYVLTQKSITEYLGSIADTAVSSYPSINPTDLESINVVIPDERLIKAFDETISPLYELKEDSAKTIQTLIKQRDELLPLLMNGQVSLNSDLSNILDCFDISFGIYDNYPKWNLSIIRNMRSLILSIFLEYFIDIGERLILQFICSHSSIYIFFSPFNGSFQFAIST